MKKQLVLWHNEKMWDKEASEYILMEPFFDRIDKPEWVEDKKIVIADDVLDDDAYEKDCKYIRRLTERLIEANVDSLNQYNEGEISVDSWKMLLMNLYGELFDYYYKYRKIEPYRDIECYTLGIKKINYNSLFRVPEQHSYLYHAYKWTKVCAFMGINVKEIDISHEPNMFNDENSTGMVPVQAETKRKKIKRYLTNPLLIRSFVCRKIFGVDKPYDYDVKNGEVALGQVRMPQSFLDHYVKESNGKIRLINFESLRLMEKSICANMSRDMNKRRERFSQNFKPQTEFEIFANEVFIELLPVQYVECLDKLYKFALDYTEKWKLRKIYHAASSDYLFRLCCAVERDEGVKICDIQHSGVYSFLETFGYPEINYYDRFLSWGWVSDSFQNIIPVAMARLPREPKSGITKTDKILFAGNYLNLDESGNGASYSHMVQEEIEFIENLPKALRSRLVIRTGNTNVLSDLEMRVRREYPEVKFENRTSISFSDSVQESVLVICDYPGSPVIESMMLGTPFLMFEGVKVMAYNKCFLKYKKAFEKLKIYFKTGKDLANELKKHKNLAEWINNPDMIELYRKFMEEFTGNNKNIMEAWYLEYMNEY